MQFLSQSDERRSFAMIALGRIEPTNSRWDKELILCLDSELRWPAVLELLRRGEHLPNAIERLRRLSREDPSWDTQVLAALAIWKIDPSAPNPLQQISEELPQHASNMVIELLGQLGPVAGPSVPALKEKRYSHWDLFPNTVRTALANIAPEYVTNPWLK
jgi:hypothetical protein